MQVLKRDTAQSKPRYSRLLSIAREADVIAVYQVYRIRSRMLLEVYVYSKLHHVLRIDNNVHVMSASQNVTFGARDAPVPENGQTNFPVGCLKLALYLKKCCSMPGRVRVRAVTGDHLPHKGTVGQRQTTIT